MVVGIRRKKNNKKIKLSQIASIVRENIGRNIIIAAVVIVFIAVLALLVKAFLYRSDYFRLGVVEARASFLDERAASAMNNQIVALYKGRNIFSIPLKSIAQAIRSNYADVRDVEVKIALPDKLLIDLKLRRPVAYVRTSKIYPIDEDGVVLPPVRSKDSLKDLPAIEGIDPRYGRKEPSKNLKLALELLKEIRQASFLTPYGVTVINAADPRSMSFYMNNGVEVKVGSENVEERLEALVRTLRDPRLVIERIAYIDVRFKEVVIGPK